MFKKGEIVKIKETNQSYRILEINKFGVKLNKGNRSWYSEDELDKIPDRINAVRPTLADHLQSFIGSHFYYYGVGEVIYKGQFDEELAFETDEGDTYYSDLNGKSNGDQVVFPLTQKRNWDLWLREYTSPKTWKDLEERGLIERCYVETNVCIGIDVISDRCGLSNFEKSLLAEIKIRQLIEKGYGGYPSFKHWKTGFICQIIPDEGEGFKIIKNVFMPKGPLFYEQKYAEEFLKYNEPLLRMYYGN